MHGIVTFYLPFKDRIKELVQKIYIKIEINLIQFDGIYSKKWL